MTTSDFSKGFLDYEDKKEGCLSENHLLERERRELESKNKKHVPDKYNKQIGGVVIDPYRIAELYGITDHRQFHVLKKMLRAGTSEKPFLTEIQDCIDTLTRWKAMMKEDFLCTENSETVSDKTSSTTSTPKAPMTLCETLQYDLLPTSVVPRELQGIRSYQKPRESS